MGDRRHIKLWAFLTPFLVLLGLALYDYGSAYWQQHKLGEAAFEGAKWAKAHGYDAGKITTTAQSATDLTGIAVTPYRPCGCAAGAAITQAQCNASCSGGGWSQPYIVVTTSMCYGTVLAWPGVPYCSSGNSQCAATGCTPKQIVLTSQSVALQ